jgi:hypothetical protein
MFVVKGEKNCLFSQRTIICTRDFNAVPNHISLLKFSVICGLNDFDIRKRKAVPVFN